MRVLAILRAASLLLLPIGVGGQITETSLTIGRDLSVVREVRRVNLPAGEQDLYLTDIPPEADLSSLTIRMRRLPVELLQWERVSEGGVERVVPSGPRITFGQSLPEETAPSAAAGAVRCRVVMPLGGERTIEVMYRLMGVQWRVEYAVSLRSELDRRAERISVDLEGKLHIANQTGRPFSNALLRVVGGDPRMEIPETDRRGFLMLADIPFADLWLADHQDVPPEQVYRLPRRFDLPAYAATQATFIQAERIPATRLFVMDESQVPLSSADTLYPLNAYLVIANTSANQLGWNLPPGPVRLDQGEAQQPSRLEGFLPHTAIGRPIRIHIGESAYVQGGRQMLRRMDVEPGRYVEIYQLTLRSRLAYPVPLEVRERPPKGLAWRVDRANTEYEVERGLVVFQPVVMAGETRRIELGLEFRESPGGAKRPVE
jgi:hypothetical protein